MNPQVQWADIQSSWLIYTHRGLDLTACLGLDFSRCKQESLLRCASVLVSLKWTIIHSHITTRQTSLMLIMCPNICSYSGSHLMLWQIHDGTLDYLRLKVFSMPKKITFVIVFVTETYVIPLTKYYKINQQVRVYCRLTCLNGKFCGDCQSN